MAKNKKNQKEIKEMSFEDTIQELRDIVTKIEEGQIPLQESIDKYERGMSLIKHCREALQQAEKKIEKISDQQQEIEESEENSDDELF